MKEPEAFSTTRGDIPRALQALTGELTPPGIRVLAVNNAFCDLVKRVCGIILTLFM
jgi:hypothetical protein